MCASGYRVIKNVTICGLKDYGYITQSSGDMRFFVPRGFVATNKVVLYCHGMDEDEDAPFTDALKDDTMLAFIDEGWGIISSLAAGNNWGNQASLEDYDALITWAKTIHAFTDLDIFAQSMGGQAGLQMFMNSAQFGRFIGIYPTCNLSWCFNSGGATFKASIKTAFSFADDADYVIATAGHDPMLESLALLNNRKMLFVASEGDLIVNKDNNTDAFITLASGDAVITLITAIGTHGDTSHFLPIRDITFLSKE